MEKISGCAGWQGDGVPLHQKQRSHFSYLRGEVPEDVSFLSADIVGQAKRAEPLCWAAGLAVRL